MFFLQKVHCGLTGYCVTPSSCDFRHKTLAKRFERKTGVNSDLLHPVMKTALAWAFFFIACQGAYGQTRDNPMCHRSHGGCFDHVNEQELSEELSKTGPSPQVLERYCTPFIDYLNCTKHYADYCVEARGVFVQADAIFNYVTEVCDNRSVLHDTYIRNYDCIYSVKPHIENCSQEAWRNEQLYRNGYRSGDDIRDEDFYKLYREAECLGKYLLVDCLAALVQESCGEEAQEGVLELATRSKHLCTEEEIVDINRQYQDLLRKDESLPARNPLRFFPYAQQQK